MDSDQKREVHQVQAELVQLWMVGSNGHTLGKERRNKTFLPTVSVLQLGVATTSPHELELLGCYQSLCVHGQEQLAG